MRKLALLLLCVHICISHNRLSAQAGPVPPDTVIYTQPDTKATFPDLQDYFQNHFTYPSVGMETGKVEVEFVVTAKGKAERFRIIKGMSYYTDAECLRVLEDMPAWKPAVKDGKKVNSLVRHTFDIEPMVIRPAQPKLPQSGGPVELVFEFVEEMPRYDSLEAYLAKNLEYPLLALENGIEGSVWLRLVIGSEGEVRDIKVVKGLMGCTDEAIRVIKKMGNWKPGRVNGHPVNVATTLEVRFQIRK